MSNNTARTSKAPTKFSTVEELTEAARSAYTVVQNEERVDREREKRAQCDHLRNAVVNALSLRPDSIKVTCRASVEVHPSSFSDDIPVCIVGDRLMFVAADDSTWVIRLLSECPKCGNVVPSADIYSLADLGAQLLSFTPNPIHRCNLVVDTFGNGPHSVAVVGRAATAGERLLSALHDLIAEAARGHRKADDDEDANKSF
jgi:hypothetical protein